MSVRGWVQACEWRPRGSELVADAAEGATVLQVEDLTDFDDAGGMVSVNDELYTYPSGGIDEDAGTITLDLGLVADATIGDGVYTVSGGQLQRDVVLFVACGDGDAVEVTAGFAQRDYWPEGDYTDPVQVLLSDDLEEIVDAPARLPESVELEQTRTDLETVLEQLEADLTELNEVTLPAVQADLAELEADLAGIAGLFPITSTSISDSAITTPKLAANAVTADKIIANSIGTGHLVALAVTGDKIAANSISADKIVANSIGAGQLAANAVYAGAIQAGAIDGKTITGATVRTAESGSRVVLDSGGVHCDGNGGSHTTQIYTDGSMEVASTAVFWAAVTAAAGLSMGGDIAMGGSSITGGGDIRGTNLYASSPSAGSAIPNARYVNTSSGGEIIYTSHANSSERYKQAIDDLDITAETAYALRPVRFEWKDENRSPDRPEGYVDVGFIAEELQALGLDRWLGFDAEGLPSEVDYAKVCVIQQVAIRDLVARVEALEAG